MWENICRYFWSSIKRGNFWLGYAMLTSGRRLRIPARSGVCILAQMQGENCWRFIPGSVPLACACKFWCRRRCARERDFVTQMPPRKHATLSINCAPPCRTHFEYSNFISKYYAHNVTPIVISVDSINKITKCISSRPKCISQRSKFNHLKFKQNRSKR